MRKRTNQVALVAGQPGSHSLVAPGEAPEEHGAARPFVAHSADDEAAEEATPPPPVKSFTEEQAPTSPVEPVLSLSGAGVSLDGDEVEEESEASTEDSSSTDPVSEWMAAWRVFRSAVYGLDVEALGPMLLSYDLDEMGEDWPQMWERLQKLIYP